MSNSTDFVDDLPPEVRDQQDLILDGYLDEFEALEEWQDAEDARAAEAGKQSPKPIEPLAAL